MFNEENTVEQMAGSSVKGEERGVK